MLVPIRNLGQYGVNTDLDPLDIPLQAFSYGANARFADSKISKAPVIAELGSSTANPVPRWAYSYRLQGSSSRYLVANQDGTIGEFAAATPGSPLTYTGLSVSGYVASSQAKSFTTTMLANVVYLNREDRVPWKMTPGDSRFATLAGGWDSGWRCKSLRTFNGCLVAINVLKGATDYPTMVKTSDFAPFGSIPATWTASTINSATENVLADLNEPLVDGWPLKDRFILYSPNETWMMSTTGDSLIYSYQRLFGNYGVISQNCIAEINNLHYVFGDNDIWMHDGFTPKSLAGNRVRRFIFDNLVRTETYQFFVWSNPKLNEVMFCFVSDDPYAAYPVGGDIGYPGCNKAAVYNWLYDTWYFYDLPYIVGGGLGEMYGGLTYNDFAGTTYNSTSSTYMGLYDSTRLFTLCVGRSFTLDNALLPLQSTGSQASVSTFLYSFELSEAVVGAGEIKAVINPPLFLENGQMDMDEISKEIRGYKVVTSCYPEGRVASTDNPWYFWWSGTDYSGQTPEWGTDHQTFDAMTLYKLDFRNPGRYLSLRIAHGAPEAAMLNAFDLEYVVTGHR